MAYVFGLQTLKLIDFTKISQLKGLKPKNKGHTNFYKCCDLMKKVYLVHILKLVFRIFFTRYKNRTESGQNLVGFEWLKSVIITGPWPKNARSKLWPDPALNRNI